MSSASPPRATTSPRRRRRGEGLLPREHGAYAMLVFPLLSALGLHPSLPGGLLGGALVAAFLAHEPLLVLLGVRGGRARRALGPRAGVRLAVLGALALALGGAGLALAVPEVRLLALAAVPAALALGLLLRAGREKSPLGEAVVALVFAFAALPVGRAGGWAYAPALVAVGVWAATFLLGTGGVHAILRRAKRGDARLGRALVAAALGVMALAGWLALAGHATALAVAPPALAVTWLVLRGTTPRELRRVGWTMVAANALTFVLLVALTG